MFLKDIVYMYRLDLYSSYCIVRVCIVLVKIRIRRCFSKVYAIAIEFIRMLTGVHFSGGFILVVFLVMTAQVFKIILSIYIVLISILGIYCMHMHCILSIKDM